MIQHSMRHSLKIVSSYLSLSPSLLSSIFCLLLILGLPGHYIGHRFSGKRIINGVKHRYHIDYVNPIDYLDTSKLPAAGITACITGQLYVVDKDFGEIFLGHIVHIVKERGVGYNELITRMWLGHIDKQGGSIGFPPPSLVNYIANSTLYRFFGLSSAWARYQWIHMVQETGCIANLLPTFYPLEMKRLQFRKENFPNGLVLDEVKNHLRNLEIENPYLEYDRPGDSMSTREYEYKSNELPRPLTVYTGLEPWEVLGASDSVDAESSSTQSFRNNSTKAAPAPKISTSSASGSSQRLSNRNTSLRARQLHQKSENITNSADKEDITPSRTTQGSSSTRVYGNDQSDDDHDDEKESTSPRELQEKSGGADYDTTISSAISYSTNSLGGGVDI